MSDIDNVIDNLDVSEPTKQLLRSVEAWTGENDGALILIGQGLLYATVCTSLSDEEADARMAALPATSSHGWMRSEDDRFHSGEANPCPCEREPDTRRHVLYEA